jgi:hypothetical protein
VVAELKSELLTPEQRAELDACLREGHMPNTELVSQVNTEALPFTGTIRDLDRDRPSVTYQDALRAVSDATAREFLREGREGEKTEISHIKKV